MFIDHFRGEIVQEENSMAFEDYKDLFPSPAVLIQKSLIGSDGKNIVTSDGNSVISQ